MEVTKTTMTTTTIRKVALWSMMSWLSFCLLLSFILALYEGYDCRFLKHLPAMIRQFPPTIALSCNINNNSNSNISSNNDQNNIDFKASIPSSGIQKDIIQLMNSGTSGMGRVTIDWIDGWMVSSYLLWPRQQWLWFW